MKKRRDTLLETSQKVSTPSDFLKIYNEGIPKSFPKASLGDLEQFEIDHPGLFKKRNEWSLDRHRKRLLDWLPLHHNKGQR